jgi:two-component system, OmpR family, response regulator ChvI
MSQLDARFGRGSSYVGSLNRLPATPAPAEWDGTFNRRQSDLLSPTRSAPLAAIGKAELRRVVLVESDQYYREVLTFELLRQGFVVHAFTDGASLLGSLTTAVDADLAVLDWDLPTMPGLELLAQLRHHGVNLPVVFLTGKVIAGVDHDQCLLASREALDAYECMAFDQGAVDFIAKSRDRQVLVRRLRRVVELVKPKADIAVEERLACDKLLLKPEISRAFWNGVDVDLTLGEYKIVHLLVSNAGSFVTYRSLYDRLHFQGFIAGSGKDGFRANVRTAIKRIRNKFRACDPTFDEIENYNGFGYCWRKPS